MTVFLAQIFKRRSQMAWDEFDEFKEDAFFVAFVEIAFIEGSENNFFAGCSCSHGTKGRNCVHTLGAYCPPGCRDSQGITGRGGGFLMRRR